MNLCYSYKVEPNLRLAQRILFKDLSLLYKYGILCAVSYKECPPYWNCSIINLANS